VGRRGEEALQERRRRELGPPEDTASNMESHTQLR
jgi:hypothetical protein